MAKHFPEPRVGETKVTEKVYIDTKYATYHHQALVIEVAFPRKRNPFGPFVLAIADEMQYAKKALSEVTGLPEGNYYYDHGSWFPEGDATGNIYEAASALIMFVTSETPGNQACSHLSWLQSYLTKAQQKQVAEWLNQIWQ